MSWRKIYAVIRREYLERVRTKGFWIATLLIPFLFLGYITLQVAISRKSTGERRIAVVDVSGRFYEPLRRELTAPPPVPTPSSESGQVTSGERPRRPQSKWVLENRPPGENLEATKEVLRQEVLEKKIDGYLVLDRKQLIEERRAEYYSTTVSEWVALTQLERALNRIRIREQIAARGLPEEVARDLERSVDMRPFKVTKEGTAEERGSGILAALIFLIIMYSTFFMYGYQVMRGVLDEKTNRIVEVIVASVRPTELMIGKIVGIGLVGLTQYFVWSLVAMNLSLPGIASMIAGGQEGIPKIPIHWIGFFILYFLLGYFLYASVYTAIAAPFNTDQEAQQLAMIPMIMIVSGFAVYPAVMNNPSGGIATFFSIFPFTASLVMFLRVTVSEPPVWHILASVASMLATTFAIAWLAGRIYRVGILMYGKKPTIPEIARWVRYKPGREPQPAVVEKT